MKMGSIFLFFNNKLRKYTLVFLIVLVVFNAWLYASEYHRYVTTAPDNLKEARKDFVKAIIPHTYYIFFIKTTRMDFQNPLLSPIKAIRDYFYHSGIAKLPANEGEKALWFDMFEVMPYNFSCKGRYGFLAKNYGYSFAEDFTNKVYENIKILTFNKITDYENKELGTYAVESYLDMADIYIAESHLSKQGFLFSEENMRNFATNYAMYSRFKDLSEWQFVFLDFHQRYHQNQYDAALNPQRGWYGPYPRYYDKIIKLYSFILFYKIQNNLFDCKNDAKYVLDLEDAKSKLVEYAKYTNISDNDMTQVYRKLNYLKIPNRDDRNSSNNGINPLGLTIDCK